jgi:hypothetical protein
MELLDFLFCLATQQCDFPVRLTFPDRVPGCAYSRDIVHCRGTVSVPEFRLAGNKDVSVLGLPFRLLVVSLHRLLNFLYRTLYRFLLVNVGHVKIS